MSIELRPYITLISRNDPWLELHNDMAGSSWAPYIAHLEKCCLSTLEYTPQMHMGIPNQTQLKVEQCYCLIVYRPLLLENVKQMANVVILKT